MNKEANKKSMCANNGITGVHFVNIETETSLRSKQFDENLYLINPMAHNFRISIVLFNLNKWVTTTQIT